MGCAWKTTPASAALKFSPSLRIRRNDGGKMVGSMRMIAESDEYMLRQMKDVADARKRWDAPIREENVKLLTLREAGYAIHLSDKPLRWNAQRYCPRLSYWPALCMIKAWVKGSTWIPIFDVDDTFDLGTAARKITNFTMVAGGVGHLLCLTTASSYEELRRNFQRTIILSLHARRVSGHSLAACKLLYKAGYRNLFWVQGGAWRLRKKRICHEKVHNLLKFSGIGGFSEFLGWTDQQRTAGAKEGWGYRLVFSARLVGVILVADALFLGAQQLSRYLQEIRPH